jgi:hypothetical protein
MNFSKSFSPRSSLRWRCFLALSLCLCVGAYCALAAAAPAKPADKEKPALVKVEIPQSVFVWNKSDPGYGRDPFFPPKPPPVAIQATTQAPETNVTPRITNVPPPKAQFQVQLNLQGIIGRNLAIINGRDFSVGEEGTVSQPGLSPAKLKIRCDEIREKTVVATVFFEDKTTLKTNLTLLQR